MTEEQARELAQSIEEQFTHVEAHVVQSADMRNAPRNWLIGVYRKNETTGSRLVLVHNTMEWQEALNALYVLSQ